MMNKMTPSTDAIVVRACSKTSQRAIDELQRTIIEIEARYKGDLSRMKKKFLSDIREMEMRIDELVRSNGELGKQNKGLAMRVKVGCYMCPSFVVPKYLLTRNYFVKIKLFSIHVIQFLEND